MTEKLERRIENAKKMLPERLRDIRRGQKLTIWEAAAMMGIKSNTLNGYETGSCMPSAKNLFIISAFYGVSMDWLMGGEW